MRLGAGEIGSGRDYVGLKNHSFFKGVDFENIHLQDPPKHDIASPFENHGDLDLEWQLTNQNRHIQEQPQVEILIEKEISSKSEAQTQIQPQKEKSISINISKE